MIILLTLLLACESEVDTTKTETQNTTEVTPATVLVTEGSSSTNSTKTNSTSAVTDKTGTQNTSASTTDGIDIITTETNKNTETE
tara:strand:+ start:3984 stop:4238 length:255 start_codon:yes stop_codon:yes gene_type:complete